MPIKKTKGGSGIPRAASSASPIESVSPKGVQDLIGSLMGGKRKRVGGTRKRVGGTRKRVGGMYATRRPCGCRPRGRSCGTSRRRCFGGKRKCNSKRRKGGGGHAGILATAALPFGLFGFQKLFQKARTRRQVRKVAKTLKKDLRKLDVRRYLKK